MLTLIIGEDWKSNRRQILSRICQDIDNQKQGIIFMVPELISHQTERDLAQLAGPASCRYAEVLSFTRLARRVSDELGVSCLDCLDKGGRIVAMAAAARQLHSKLKSYASVETKPEFLMGLLDAVDEFKRCCITPADLLAAAGKTQGLLAQKLEELSLILEAYDAICSRSKRDPRDLMRWLLSHLEESDFGEKHTFYFDAFPDYSRQHMDILEHLLLVSPNVTVSVNCDMPGSRKLAYEKAGETAKALMGFAKRHEIPVNLICVPAAEGPLQSVTEHLLQGSLSENSAGEALRLCKADSVYSECAWVAEQILSLVHSGCRFRDISVVLSDVSTYKTTLQNTLQRARIPLYLSGTEDILEKSVIHTVLTAIETALGGFDSRDVMRYMRSFLSPVELDLCDRMENYAVLWSVEGSRWLRPWQEHPRGLEEEWTERDHTLLRQLNRGREQVVEPLERLRDAFRQEVSTQKQVGAIYRFLRDIRLDDRLRTMADGLAQQGDHAGAQVLNQLWDILMNALEQLHGVLAEISWDAETFTRLLKLLLSQYDVGTIPSVLDAVMAGGVSAMRCQSPRHLFVLGAAEGKFPSYATASGVLNDQERSLLIRLGVGLNPGTIDGLQTQFSEIQEVFCGAQETITVTCPDGQPSYIYNRLLTMAGQELSAGKPLGYALTDPWEAAAYLAGLGQLQAARQLGLEEQYQAIERQKAYELGAVAPENILALYGGKLNLSATQIDRMADCRLSYFLRYGLSAKERKPITVDPAEFGSYVHAVLEECGKKILSMGGFREVSLEKTLELAAEYSARYFAKRFQQINTERLSFHFRKNSFELQMIVTELWKEMQESSFQPSQFELGFGAEEEMPAITVADGPLPAKLGGFVDRVDIWKSEDKLYLRVVDYKTGAKDFDYCDVLNGLGLQMLLYLFALEEEGELLYGEKPAVAGVQYFPARIPFVKADGFIDDRQVEKQRNTDLKRKGLILAEEPVLKAMEDAQEPVRLSCARKADGTISGDVASSQQFQKLKRYVFGLLEKLVADIASGNVTPNPYTRGDKHNACRFCPYGAVCHSADVPGRRNYKAVKADRFWEEIEKGV